MDYHKHAKEATKSIRHLIGPNRWFEWNEYERQFEFWELRGPMRQMIFPLTMMGHAVNEISDYEKYHAVMFVKRKRSEQSEEDYFKHKEYKKWTNPDEYVDWRPKDESKWENSSPRPEGYKKVKSNAVVN